MVLQPYWIYHKNYKRKKQRNTPLKRSPGKGLQSLIALFLVYIEMMEFKVLTQSFEKSLQLCDGTLGKVFACSWLFKYHCLQYLVDISCTHSTDMFPQMAFFVFHQNWNLFVFQHHPS